MVLGGAFFFCPFCAFWALSLFGAFFVVFAIFVEPFLFWGLFWVPFWGGGLFFRGLLFVYLLSVCWGDPGLVTTADTVSDQDKGGEAQLSHKLQPKKALRPDTREGPETRHTITHPITQINSQRIFCCVRNVLCKWKIDSEIIFLCNHFGINSNGPFKGQ